jgi:hypothetical protein
VRDQISYPNSTTGKITVFTKYYNDHQIKEDEIRGESSAHGRNEERNVKYYSENLKGSGYLGDLSVNGRIL